MCWLEVFRKFCTLKLSGSRSIYMSRDPSDKKIDPAPWTHVLRWVNVPSVDMEEARFTTCTGASSTFGGAVTSSITAALGSRMIDRNGAISTLTSLPSQFTPGSQNSNLRGQKQTCQSGPVQEEGCPIPSTQRWSQYSTAPYSWLYVRMNKHYQRPLKVWCAPLTLHKSLIWECGREGECATLMVIVALPVTTFPL